MPEDEKTQDQADGAAGATTNAPLPSEDEAREEPKGGEG